MSDSYVTSKDFAKHKYRSSHKKDRNNNRGRSQKPSKGSSEAENVNAFNRASVDGSTSGDDRAENEDNLAPSGARGADFEQLVAEAELHYGQAYYRHLAVHREAEAMLPPWEVEGHSEPPDYDFNLNIETLAASLCHLPIHIILGVEEQYVEELMPLAAPPNRPSTSSTNIHTKENQNAGPSRNHSADRKETALGKTVSQDATQLSQATPSGQQSMESSSQSILDSCVNRISSSHESRSRSEDLSSQVTKLPTPSVLTNRQPPPLPVATTPVQQLACGASHSSKSTQPQVVRVAGLGAKSSDSEIGGDPDLDALLGSTMTPRHLVHTQNAERSFATNTSQNIGGSVPLPAALNIVSSTSSVATLQPKSVQISSATVNISALKTEGGSSPMSMSKPTATSTGDEDLDMLLGLGTQGQKHGPPGGGLKGMLTMHGKVGSIAFPAGIAESSQKQSTMPSTLPSVVKQPSAAAGGVKSLEDWLDGM